MKVLITFLLALVGWQEVAFACPDFSGQYKYANEPWNGFITIKQKDCVDITVIQTRTTPTGVSRQVQFLRMDGKPYAGIENARTKADLDTVWFQKVSLESDRLVFRQYSGARKICGGKYSFNGRRCHLIEYSMSRHTEGWVWSQTGVWWTDGGKFSTDRYLLHKEEDSMRTVAAL